MIDMNAILAKIDDLPAFPVVVSRVMGMFGDPDVTAEQIADTVKLDQSLTTAVLRRCNSSYFGLRREITSLREAIVYIGLADLKRMIIRSGTAKYFEKKKDGYEVEQGELWAHSIAVSTIADKIKDMFGVENSDYAYIAALLHDVGKLVMSVFVNEKTKKISEILENEEVSFLDAEMQVLGITHPEIGAKVLEVWKFPEEIITTVRRHHSPMDENSTAIENTVRTADGLAMMMGFGTNADGLRYQGFSDICDKYDIHKKTLETIMAETLDDITGTLSEYGFTKGE